MVDPIYQIQDALAGRYSIKRELGKGGMATVWLARGVRHDRFVALKFDAAGPRVVGRHRTILPRNPYHRPAPPSTHPPVFDSGEVGTPEAGGTWLRIDPNFSALRDNPEFQRLVRSSNRS